MSVAPHRRWARTVICTALLMAGLLVPVVLSMPGPAWGPPGARYASTPSLLKDHAPAPEDTSEGTPSLTDRGSLRSGETASVPVQPAFTSTWTNMSPPSFPSARYYHRMVYNSESKVVIMFGGHSGTYLDDTWAYDLNLNYWSLPNPLSRPSPRYAHAMAYDSQSDRVVLFGGWDGNNRLNDTWAYDYDNNTWTQMSPLTSPPVRSGHAMAYDSQSDRVILFGGYGGGYLNDTWAYDYDTNTWAQMSPLTSPPPVRAYHAMAYDSQSDRFVLFGGWDGNNRRNDTWVYEYDTDTWKMMSPGNRPSGRSSHVMAYDSQSDRVILFGGYGSSKLNDTWAYDLDTDTWTDTEAVPAPPARDQSALAYDPQANRAILFGGTDAGGSFLDDTWAYDLSILGAPRNVSASAAGDGSIDLTWQPPAENGGSPIAAYRIYRGTSYGHGGLLVTLPGTMSGYTDDVPVPGRKYFYRVGAVSAAGEVGPLSPDRSAVALVTPGPPRHLQAVSGNGRIDLAWEPPYFDGGGPIAGYHIYRGTSPGGETYLITIFKANYTDGSVTPGTTYYYRVSGMNDAGEGPLSNEVGAYAMSVPGAPLLYSAVGGSGRVTLTWDLPDDGGSPILSIQVWRGTSPGNETFLVSVSGSATSAVDWWAEPGVTYYYMVRAVNAAGPGPFSGEMSAAATSAHPPPGTASMPPGQDTAGEPWHPFAVRCAAAGIPHRSS